MKPGFRINEVRPFQFTKWQWAGVRASALEDGDYSPAIRFGLETKDAHEPKYISISVTQATFPTIPHVRDYTENKNSSKVRKPAN